MKISSRSWSNAPWRRDWAPTALQRARLIGLVVLLGLVLAPPAQAAAAEEETIRPHWSRDPSCQETFFAILQGCYRAGVPDAVVDAIILPPEADDPHVQHSFVFRCRLCHAVYDAFVTYRRRPSFLSAEAEIDHFHEAGPEHEEHWAQILEQLRSDEPRNRVLAMGSFIRPWIVDHYRRRHLAAEDLRQVVKDLLVLALEGDEIFRGLRNDPHSPYRKWTFYGGCQACEAASDLSQLINATRREAGAPAP